MASAGTDARTGRILRDFDHVVQSYARLLNINIGELLMLRGYGAGVPTLLGRRILPRLLSLYITLLALAIKTWEPRLAVVSVDASGNTVDGVRLGDLNFVAQVYYRPNALRGDFTVEGGLRQVAIGATDGRITAYSVVA